MVEEYSSSPRMQETFQEIITQVKDAGESGWFLHNGDYDVTVITHTSDPNNTDNLSPNMRVCFLSNGDAVFLQNNIGSTPTWHSEAGEPMIFRALGDLFGVDFYSPEEIAGDRELQEIFGWDNSSIDRDDEDEDE